MKKINTKFLIISLFSTLLLIATGYAIFGQNLIISGTANTKGTFNVQFISATLQGTVGATPTAVISSDKNNLAINVADLTHPGAGTQVNVVVKNVGTIPALLKTVNIAGNNDPDITIDILNMPTNVTLGANDERTFSIIVKWNTNSTLATTKNIIFSADLVYEQNTTNFGQ